MKIGILTAARTNNFGTDLQAFAMQKLFGRYCDTQIIDYVCPKLENSHKLLPVLSVVNMIRLPWAIFKNISHYLFRKKYFNKSKKYTTSTLSSINYDKVVVGSDQIWNLDITGNDLNFFLPIDGVRKYSYAASIGKTDISHWQKKYDLKRYLEKFSGISVRESVGVDALNKIGVEAQWHLDPLLMIDEKEWLELANCKKIKGRYVFVYLVQDSKDAMDYAFDYAKRYGAKIVVFQKPGKFKKNIKKCVYCSVNRWLTYMKYADMIITNSYHGLSIALALKTNFRIFGISNSVQNNSRMENLLERLDMKQYMYSGKKFFDDLEPDWEKAKICLNADRQKSFEYIEHIINS